MAVIGFWAQNSIQIGVLNVYAPQQAQLKKQLWLSIQSLILGNNNLVWIIFGDFNEVMEEIERKGTRFSLPGAVVFNNFIASVGLIEVRNGGRRYTHISTDGSKLSKLDRVLVSHNCFDNCPNLVVEILP